MNPTDTKPTDAAVETIADKIIEELGARSSARQDIIALLAPVLADNAALMEGLKKYGEHCERCSRQPHPSFCCCGLDDLLSAPKPGADLLAELEAAKAQLALRGTPSEQLHSAYVEGWSDCMNTFGHVAIPPDVTPEAAFLKSDTARRLGSYAEDVTVLRRERDDLRAKLETAERERDEAREDLALTSAQWKEKLDQVVALRATVDRLTKERDEEKDHACFFKLKYEATSLEAGHLEYQRDSALALLRVLQKDYDHRWPDEDAVTKVYRITMLERIGAILASQPAPQPDGWIPWSGGECPVPGETMVEVKFRDLYTNGPMEAHMWTRGESDWWKHADRNHSNDIIAYRIAQPAPTTDQVPIDTDSVAAPNVQAERPL